MCSGAICYSLALLHSKWVEYVLLFRNATIPQGKYRLKTIKRVTRQAVKFLLSWHNILERNITSICICACFFFPEVFKKSFNNKSFSTNQIFFNNYLSIGYGYGLYSFNFHKISGNIVLWSPAAQSLINGLYLTK